MDDHPLQIGVCVQFFHPCVDCAEEFDPPQHAGWCLTLKVMTLHFGFESTPRACRRIFAVAAVERLSKREVLVAQLDKTALLWTMIGVTHPVDIPVDFVQGAFGPAISFLQELSNANASRFEMDCHGYLLSHR
jgi:hypothetical protein